jgi:hypothetical protein
MHNSRVCDCDACHDRFWKEEVMTSNFSKAKRRYRKIKRRLLFREVVETLFIYIFIVLWFSAVLSAILFFLWLCNISVS